MDSDRPPSPSEPARRWPNVRPVDPALDVIVRIGVVVMPVVMIVAGIVGPSAGPAVFGGIWLPLSIWVVVIGPLSRRSRKR